MPGLAPGILVSADDLADRLSKSFLLALRQLTEPTDHKLLLDRRADRLDDGRFDEAGALPVLDLNFADRAGLPRLVVTAIIITSRLA